MPAKKQLRRRRNIVERTLDTIDELDRHFRTTSDRTAILFADLVASTTYKQLRGPIAGLHKTWRHNKTITQIIQQHGGVVVKYLGDGVLARFDFGTDEHEVYRAINAAIAVQEAFHLENRGVADSIERIETRIGIALGVVVEFYGHDPQGPIVDVAARIQSLAKPGQILIHADLLRAVNSNRIESARARIHAWAGSQHLSSPVPRTLRGVPEPQNIVEVRWTEQFQGVAGSASAYEECWEDYQYNAMVYELEPELGELARTHFGISFDLKYRAALDRTSFSFACVASRSRFDAAMRDPRFFSRYCLPGRLAVSARVSQLFTVPFFRVSDIPIHEATAKLMREEGYFHRVFQSDDLALLVGKRVTFHYQMKSVIAKRNNLFYMVTEFPIRGLAMTFDVGSAAIRRVAPAHYFATQKVPHIVFTPDEATARKIEIHLDDWIPPRGGVAFVWDLIDPASAAIPANP